MRTIPFAIALFVFAAPSFAIAQYDFDDFLKAVESGQSKSTPPSLVMPRLAQLPNGREPSGMLESDSPQPIPQREPAKTELLPVPEATQTASVPSYAAPVENQPIPNQIQVEQSPPNKVNFEDLFEQQDVGLATPACHCKSGCQSCNHSAHARECAVMPYHTPNLPPPASLRGYFNASPCIANVWDGYSCEAAAACAKKQQILRGTHSHSQACACGKSHCE